MFIHTAEAAAKLLGPLLQESAEELVAVVHLAGDMRLRALTFERSGGTDEVELHPGEILKGALRNGSEAIILAHNHPSGDPTPSAVDRSATRALCQAAAAVDVRVFDHLVFGGKDWRSFRKLGLL